MNMRDACDTTYAFRLDGRVAEKGYFYNSAKGYYWYATHGTIKFGYLEINEWYS